MNVSEGELQQIYTQTLQAFIYACNMNRSMECVVMAIMKKMWACAKCLDLAMFFFFYIFIKKL